MWEKISLQFSHQQSQQNHVSAELTAAATWFPYESKHEVLAELTAAATEIQLPVVYDVPGNTLLRLESKS